ncbi:MAG: hypothetical protein IPL26_23990 [Leptospiraceae bacterium]|nr:hypothetical protein [Leptospiraceae bacterium]
MPKKTFALLPDSDLKSILPLSRVKIFYMNFFTKVTELPFSLYSKLSKKGLIITIPLMS